MRHVVFSSLTRDRIWAPCIECRSLSHWTIREIPSFFFMTNIPFCVYIHTTYIYTYMGFPGGSVVKTLPINAGSTGDSGSNSGLGRSPGRGNDNTLQYSYLENSMNRGAWRATVHGTFQARIFEWVAISSSRGSSQPSDRTLISSISCIGRQIL